MAVDVGMAAVGAVVGIDVGVDSADGAPVDDGIWLTDLDRGDSRLLVSIAQIVEQAGPAPSVVRGRRGDWFGFHVKWNPQGTGLMFVLRWLPRSWLPARTAKRPSDQK